MDLHCSSQVVTSHHSTPREPSTGEETAFLSKKKVPPNHDDSTSINAKLPSREEKVELSNDDDKAQIVKENENDKISNMEVKSQNGKHRRMMPATKPGAVAVVLASASRIDGGNSAVPPNHDDSTIINAKLPSQEEKVELSSNSDDKAQIVKENENDKISNMEVESQNGKHRRMMPATKPGAVAVVVLASASGIDGGNSAGYHMKDDVDPPTPSPSANQDGKNRRAMVPASKPGAVAVVAGSSAVSTEATTLDEDDKQQENQADGGDRKLAPSYSSSMAISTRRDRKERRGTGASKPGAVSVSSTKPSASTQEVVSIAKGESGAVSVSPTKTRTTSKQAAPGEQQEELYIKLPEMLLSPDDEHKYQHEEGGHPASSEGKARQASPAIKPGAITGVSRSDSRDAASAENNGPVEHSSSRGLAAVTPGRADENASKKGAPTTHEDFLETKLPSSHQAPGVVSIVPPPHDTEHQESDDHKYAGSAQFVKEKSAAMLLTAHLVSEDEDPDLIYKKAQQEAEEVVRRQILGDVVEAQVAEAVPDYSKEAREEEKVSRGRRQRFLCLALVLLVVVLGAAVGGVVGTRCNREDCDGERVVAVAATNDECPSATAVRLNGTRTSRYFGSFKDAGLDDVLDGCGGVELSGPGIWFAVNGTGLPIQASTCDNAVVDTQITVFTGTCDGLQCVGANDDACGQQSLIVWLSVKDETYYVMVTGTDLESAANPEFSLLVTETAANDVCETAEPIQLLAMGDATLSGSTVGATLDNSVPECGSAGSDRGAGTWYEIRGTGLPMRASTCENTRTGGGTVTLFSGDCGALQCINARYYEDCEVMWATDENEVYYLLVAGLGEGLFQLFISEVVANDFCYSATPIPEVNGTMIVAGTTLGASIDVSVPGCGQATASTAPGVWFSVVGNGNIYTMDNCNEFLGAADPFDSQISVFRGDHCADLACVGGNDDYCDSQSLVSWVALEGQVYLILVHGYSEGGGDFNLTFSEETMARSDQCEDAVGPLLPTWFEGTMSTTAGARPGEIQACSSTSTFTPISPGSWFTVRGTGSSLRASTCDSRTYFNTIVSVFVGDGCGRDQLECVDAENRFCVSADLQFSQGVATWETETDRLYYILVQGAHQEQTGSLKLRIEDVSLESDKCEEESALLLTPNGESVFGSTATALPQDVLDVSCDTTPGNRGIWYRVQGTGIAMKASLCSNFTDFDTKLSIFVGPCENLTCVDSDDDGCGRPRGPSTVSWQSDARETYSILVHGFDNVVGKFALEVSSFIVLTAP